MNRPRIMTFVKVTPTAPTHVLNVPAQGKPYVPQRVTREQVRSGTSEQAGTKVPNPFSRPATPVPTESISQPSNIPSGLSADKQLARVYRNVSREIASEPCFRGKADSCVRVKGMYGTRGQVFEARATGADGTIGYGHTAVRKV
jgi:hypothetical protein